MDLDVKDVKGFEDYFAITEDGKLWSKRTKKELKQTVSKTGYYTVATKIGGRTGTHHCFKVHRLVAIAFVDNPNDKPFVNHKDGNKLNNHKDNLEWCTQQENTIHAYETGLFSKQTGEINSGATLTNIQAEEIRTLYGTGKYTQNDLAIEYGVGRWVIGKVVRNESYKKN